MAKKKILIYTIHLRDAALAQAVQDQLGRPEGGPLAGERLNYTFTGTGEYLIWRAPLGAADEYAINAGTFPPALPLVNVGDPIPSGGVGYITSEWFNSSNTFPRDVATFTISSGWWIFGSSTKYYWGARVAYAPALEVPTTSGVPEQIDPAPIPARMALVSGGVSDFECASGLPNGVIQSGTSLMHNRTSSRRIDGFGKMHSTNAGSQRVFGLQFNTPFPTSFWARAYIRVPEAPSVSTHFFQCAQVAVSGVGFSAQITGAMQLALSYEDPNVVLIGTFGNITPNKWTKVDFVGWVDAPGNTLYLDAYINGTKVASVSGTAGGLEINRMWSTVHFGKNDGNLTTTARLEYDDCIVAFPPKTRDRGVPTYNAGNSYVSGDYVHTGGTDPATWNTYKAIAAVGVGQAPGPPNTSLWRKQKDSIDWRRGSHLQEVGPKAFAATHSVNWIGDWRVLAKENPSNISIGTTLTCNVALSLLAVQMGMEVVDSLPNCLGWAAMQGTWIVGAGGAPDGQFGYKIGGAAPVLTTVVQGAGIEGHSQLFSLPANTIDPQALGTALELHHTKANDATNATAAMAQACVECIGIFGEEDLDPTELPAPPFPEVQTDRHNCQIPLSPWANSRTALGPVMIVGGTYVGNGTGQDLAFKVPPLMIWIRNTTTLGNAPTVWFPTLLDGRPGGDQGTYLWGAMNLRQDLGFAPGSPSDDQQMRWLLSLGGANGSENQNAQTYQYIAFCDPMRRYALSGVETVSSNRVPFGHSLDIDGWTPEFLFLFKDIITSATADGLFAKHTSHGADVLKDVSGTTVANALTMAAGLLTFRAGLVTGDFDQFPYLGFRRDDGNHDPNQARVFFLGSYTGDGAASRTISLAPATGRRLMWALVMPDGATSWYRDPTHTTTNSQQFGGTQAATGITGGNIDSFSVGSSLNTNGVNFVYFGFYAADATAGNGGWGTNGENVPVPSETPGESTEPVEIPAATTPPVVLVDEPDLEDTTVIGSSSFNVGGLLGGQTCRVYTQKVVNRALHHLGISKRISNIATDATEMAYQSRDHIKEDINAVLREFPWPFATKYAELVLVGGTTTDPVNDDWQYSYRGPNAMMFARRLLTNDGKRRAYDEDPIEFRLAMDSSGPLIYTNQEATTDAPLTLEYTERFLCPLFFGDALFREAVAWKHAASLAMALSRDSKKQAFCLSMYERLLPRASAPAANEQQPADDGDAPWIIDRQ